MNPNKERLHWVDALRGVFILMMVVFHVGFIFEYAGLWPIDTSAGLWWLLARTTEFGFFGCVGLSLYLSYRRSDPGAFLGKQYRRAATVFGAGVAITVATLLLLPQAPIWFGALHFIATSILIGAWLTPHPRVAAGLLLPIVLLGEIVTHFHPAQSALLVFGLIPTDFSSFDYFPLFPWLAIVLAGILTGHALDHYDILEKSRGRFRMPVLEWAGRHALAIYLIHPLVIVGLAWLWRVV